MGILRYWQLFYGKQYNLKGTKARAQVLKYYNRDNNKGVEGTENCVEEQTKQLRSRTALTRKGPSSRLLGNSTTSLAESRTANTYVRYFGFRGKDSR